ncbi:hypothetical protein GE061_016968 [Apolygus lucorum]|uniref:Uncharacterized protein n=1 Tax=Apolygus lucorum TaxID=248454 RepID=A0A8S9XHG9_APOLU|nr:hypothetical protein GE061_016968 [Apolygus lucorum]
MNRKQNPYSFVEDYGFNHRFGIAPDSSKDQFFHSILEKIFPTLVSEGKEDDGSRNSSSSESSESESDDDDYPEVHHCRIYSCKDPECFSCELANDCFNCSHCGLNRTLQLPCLDCKSSDIHSLATHNEVRCSYHKDFPKVVTPQFSVCHDTSQISRSTYVPLDLESTKDAPLMKDRDKLAQYIASKNISSSERKDELLRNVLDRTYSQCQINTHLDPQFELNVDTSKYETKSIVPPPELKMPRIIPPPKRDRTESKDPGLSQGEKVDSPVVAVDQNTKQDVTSAQPPQPIQNEGNVQNFVCKCCKVDDETCAYPEDHLISKIHACSAPKIMSPLASVTGRGNFWRNARQTSTRP